MGNIPQLPNMEASRDTPSMLEHRLNAAANYMQQPAQTHGASAKMRPFHYRIPNPW
jgi:hypothetical protein